jgi:hypothetical protein
VGVPAARGHGGDGGADIRGGLRGPEHIASLPAGRGGVDRPLGTFSASTKVLERCFAAFSLQYFGFKATRVGGMHAGTVQNSSTCCRD